MFRNVAVGISGGVDSAVAALLLKQKGFNVVGVFMRNWDEFDEAGQCSGQQDLLDAQYACHKIGIELRQISYVKDYWHTVFSHFLEDYQIGLTPNPDILCNKHIKFDLFYKQALEQLDCDAIATGHYAKSNFGTYLNAYKADEPMRLLLPKDAFKDQTFFLSAVSNASLRKAMFPLDSLLKSQVRQIAEQHGLARLAHKKDSTGICFVGQRNFKQFIKQYIHSQAGNFVDVNNGRILGTHEGIHQWTIGQRCRLHSQLQAYYVAAKDAVSNTIFIAPGHEHAAFYHNRLIAKDLNWLSPSVLSCHQPLRCRFRFQHTKPLTDCTVQRYGADGRLVVIDLDTALRALTPGQYAAFYSSEECLGSARIIAVLNRKNVQNALGDSLDKRKRQQLSC